MQGKVGNQYWLNITLPDGSSYRSQPETLLPVPAIDSVYYRIVEETLYDPANRPYSSTKLPIYVSVQDPVATDNFYRWDWNALEQIFTLSQLDTAVTTCYLIPSLKRNNSIVISGDEFNNGNEFEQLIYTLPYDRSSQFLITVHQYSLNKSAYDYWQQVLQESRRTGSIFDPAPINVAGNIVSEDDTQKTVLGYFMASAVTNKRLLIDRSIVKGTPDDLRDFGDCRFIYPNSFEEKPEGFK
jgi:hypothetical protein